MWNGPDTSVYLTFDDGPHPVSTPAVLAELKKRKLRASFFLTGSSSLQYPELVGEIKRAGHTIGNHAYDHRLMLFKSVHTIREQIMKTADTIERIVGFKTRMFRPPFGYFGPTAYRLAKETGHLLVLWDVDSADYEQRDPAEIAQRTSDRTRPGSIILFHDNESTKATIVEILDRYLDSVQSKEFRLTPLKI